MSIVATSKPDTAPKKRVRSRSPKLPFWLIVPAVGALAVGLAYPMGWQVFNSMREYGLRQQFGEAAPWVWFANYTTLLSDSFFWTVVVRSLVFMAATAIATMSDLPITFLIVVVPPRT